VFPVSFFSVKVKFLCLIVFVYLYVCTAWKGHPRNDLGGTLNPTHSLTLLFVSVIYRKIGFYNVALHQSVFQLILCVASWGSWPPMLFLSAALVVVTIIVQCLRELL